MILKQIESGPEQEPQNGKRRVDLTKMTADTRMDLLSKLVPQTITIKAENVAIVQEASDRYFNRANNAKLLADKARNDRDEYHYKKNFATWKKTMHKWIIAEELLEKPGQTMNREDAIRECQSRLEQLFTMEYFNESWAVIHGYAEKGGETVRKAKPIVEDKFDARDEFIRRSEDRPNPAAQKRQQRKAA